VIIPAVCSIIAIASAVLFFSLLRIFISMVIFIVKAAKNISVKMSWVNELCMSSFCVAVIVWSSLFLKFA